MRRFALCLITVAALLPSGPAHADDKAAQAREAFNKARDHFKAKNYNEAMVELNRAYALKPHPSLLRYMGDTYYKLNKARQAIKLYNQYLKMAPMAADRDRIEEKVRQLELIVGAGEEEEDQPPRPAVAPPPPPPPAAPPPVAAPPRPAPARPAKKIDMRPTGDDAENPLAHQAGRRAGAPAAGGRRGEGGSPAVAVAKWTTLGVGVAGIALGVVFNRLAASKAEALEEAVKTDCPPDQPTCSGNPDMNRPVVSYSKRHHDMLQAYKLNQTGSIISFVSGGVLIGTSIVLFVLDRPTAERRRADAGGRVAVAPVVSGDVFGLAGEVSF